MIGAIDSAREYVYFSTYIFDGGPLGQRFAAALAAAAERGADVRVLLDGFGEWYSWRRASNLFRGTRVRFARFLPPRLWPPTVNVNLRNHRKILAVDGVAAFTGGINVRDRYLDGAADERIVDSHFRLSGPVLAQIETVFLRDWQFATGDASTAARHVPQPSGAALCRAVADGPDTALDRLTALLTGAIGSARQRVAIMTPYFVPPRELIAPLQAAALAGVDVAVILPARNNLPYVHRATRHMLWELLQRGVQGLLPAAAVRAQQALLCRRLLRADRLGELRRAQLALELRDERRGVRPRHRDRASAALRSGSSSIRSRDVGGRRWPPVRHQGGRRRRLVVLTLPVNAPWPGRWRAPRQARARSCRTTARIPANFAGSADSV